MNGVVAANLEDHRECDQTCQLRQEETHLPRLDEDSSTEWTVAG